MPSASVERVLAHLWALDCNPRGSDDRGYSAKCPNHEDRNPSLSVGQGHDGRALVYCHRGCALEDIATALHLDLTELFEPDDKPTDPSPRVVVERYDYVNEAGELLFQVERTKPKGFRQRRPRRPEDPPDQYGKRGPWVYALDVPGVGIKTRRVLYRLPRVLAAVKAGELICVVEGERDVHTLEAKGKVATTNPGGAGSWRPEYSETLRGANVAIIQDVDPADKKTGRHPGQEHAEVVRQALDGVAAKVKVLQPAVGSDITDHIKAGLPLGALVDAAAPRPPTGLQVLSTQEVMALPDPDVRGNLLGPLIYKGYRIVIGGHTGHGKTTFVMHMVAAAVNGTDFLHPAWHGRGEVRALIVDVEQGTKSVKRVLREVGLDKSQNVKYLRVPDGLALDSDKDAIAFMEKSFTDGRYDIVLADPLYKLHRGDPNDSQAAAELMRRFDYWRERYEFALILPMHCRKPHPNAPLSAHDLFGSSAYQWGAEVLLGIERPKDTDAYTLMHFWKDRDGEITETAPLNGRWGLMFDRGEGFRKAAKITKLHSQDVVHNLLKEHGALTLPEIEDMWPTANGRAPKRETIRNALKMIPGVTHDGQKGKEARIYQLPVPMLDTPSYVPERT